MISKVLKGIAQFIFRYGLAFTFIWLGVLKFKNIEADYLKNVLADSVLFSWMLKYITIYAFAQIVAYLQIVIGVLIALQAVSKKMAFIGGILAMIVLFLSVSSIFSSGFVWEPGYGFPELSKLGQSMLKDLLLFGAAAWCTSESV